MANNHGIIRTIYLYLFALVGLFVFIFGAVNGVSAVLDRYVWQQNFVSYDAPVPAMDGTTKVVKPTPAEEAKTLEKQKEDFKKQQDNNFRNRMNNAIPSVIIGYLLWRFHWKEIKKDREA